MLFEAQLGWTLVVNRFFLYFHSYWQRDVSFLFNTNLKEISTILFYYRKFQSLIGENAPWAGDELLLPPFTMLLTLSSDA
jgi:hypothetical protein